MSFLQGLLGSPNVEKMKAKGNVRGLINAMRNIHLEPSVRMAATQALGEIGDAKAVEPLIAALGEKNPDFRIHAAVALGQMGTPAVEPLIEVLKHKDWRRMAAAEALGKIGDPRAVAPLIKVIEETPAGGRKIVAQALGKIGDPRAVEPLIKVFKSGYLGEYEFAAEALGLIGDARAAKPLMAKLTGLSPKHESVVRAVGEALENIGGPSAEPLVEGLSEGSYLPDVKTKVIEVLGQIGEPAIEHLIKALETTSKSWQWARLVEALDEIGWQPTMDEAGAAYWIAKENYEKCIEIGTPAIAPLILVLGHHADEGVLRALRGIGAPALEPLITGLQKGDVPWCQASVRALESLGWQPEMDEMGARYWIEKTEWEECVKIGSPAVAPLIKALRTSETEAVKTLGQIGESAVEPLITAIKNWSTVPKGWPKELYIQLQKSALLALLEIGHKATIILTKALYDWKKAERIAVIDALETTGWQPDIDELSALYWISKREWEKCAEIGTPAVQPLLEALRNEDLRDPKAVAEALNRIGWQPGLDEAGATYWIVKRNWEKCVEIGKPAVVPLKKAIEQGDPYVRKAVVRTLESIGWQPDNSAAGAIYWIEKRKWDKCVEIGGPAVGPLIAELDNQNWNDRKAAAQALAQIYLSGKLGVEYKHLILAERDKVGKQHTDRKIHDDFPACQQEDGEHKSTWTHNDYGIGVKFPF